MTTLPGVIVLQSTLHTDARGYFFEIWNQRHHESAQLPAVFEQDNISFSGPGVLRGLHFQHPQAQGKLVCVLRGEIFDVAVDIRVGSPTFKHWFGVTLSAVNHRQIYIPEGFAHGFCVTGTEALVMYKCTQAYLPEADAVLRWDDEEIGIAWPVAQPLLSAKDAAAPTLQDFPRERLPVYAQASAER